MSKHTPGPWKWASMGQETVLWGEHGMRPIVLDFVRKGMQGAAPRIRKGGIMYPFEPEHPDARLIAAAPSLLSALEAVEWEASDTTDFGCRSFAICPECKEPKLDGHAPDCALHAALLLARGEAVVRSTSETTSPHTKDPR